MITITLEILSGHWKRTSTHRTADVSEARDRAIKKLFGRRASWWPDSGLGPRYGQVIKPADTGGYNCVTGRVRIWVNGN